jgi:hypothetical protein
MAAFCSLQCTKNTVIEIPMGTWGLAHEKGRRKPAAFYQLEPDAAYSAACLRGGSSAPESWISVTW